MIKAIFFDFDGVLTSEYSGLGATIKNLQRAIPGFSADRYKECYQLTVKNDCESMLE